MSADAEQGRHQARGEVAGAEEQIDQRVQLEQQRPVHHRVVDVALAVEQAPRIEGVQALVVVEGLGAEVPEAQDQADEHQPQERQILGVDRDLDRVAPPTGGGVPAAVDASDSAAAVGSPGRGPLAGRLASESRRTWRREAPPGP